MDSCTRQKNIDRVLEQMGQLSGQLDKVYDEVVATKGLMEEVLSLLTQLMERFDLSEQVKLRDEFTQHNSILNIGTNLTFNGSSTVEALAEFQS